jgi:chromosome segregation ATPase
MLWTSLYGSSRCKCVTFWFLQAAVDRLTAELSETTAEAAHTKLLYKSCQQRVDAALTDLQQSQHELHQAQKDLEWMHQHAAPTIGDNEAYKTR